MTTLTQSASPVHVESFEPSESDTSWWAAFTDQIPPTVVTQPIFPGEPLLSFAEKIADQASYFRSLDTDFGNWLAKRLDRLEEAARFLGVSCPDDFEDRLEALTHSSVI